MAGPYFGISGGKNKTKSSSTTDTSLDAWSKGIYGDLSGQVRGLLAQPFQAYGGPLSAGVNGYETAAADLAAKASGYTPGKISAGAFTDADMAAYANPYTEAVLGGVLSDAATARDRQQVADAQDATRAGAWNGARHGVAEGLTNSAYLKQVSDASAQIRASAFDRAADLWGQDRAARLQAEQANQTAGLQAAQLGLTGAGVMGQLGAQLRGAQQDAYDRAYAEFVRAQDDPGKRADALLKLLQATPMFYDTRETGKSTGTNIGFKAGYGEG
ncbi:hypothetical protein [Caulobacter sp. 17J80-11]|uniref:hypothetical protein n=1 Tax=Caulobacter sp. 17J80-11 TaxID=2763502 RepID=UPI001653A9D2|nr:hypothetical protein [Caulobacter sp. 17J80-11]MBC6982104.1 hypothetical protein [Caulobacter sp. 17J80-11]